MHMGVATHVVNDVPSGTFCQQRHSVLFPFRQLRSRCVSSCAAIMASSVARHKSREEMKRARELEEARKAGLAPAEIDAETGQAINPHIPNYMTTAPWYLNQDKPSLQHQKDWRVKGTLEEKWYSRGARGKANRKFKAGACEKYVRTPWAGLSVYTQLSYGTD
jgi:hypothetical protein